MTVQDDAFAVVPGQSTLFGEDEEFVIAWQEWQGMPEFSMEDLMPWKTLTVHFESHLDLEAFRNLIGQKLHISPQSSIWFPPRENESFTDRRYIHEP